MTKKKQPKRTLPELPALPDELLQERFPGGFTVRDEANALTAWAFRNGILEDLHAGSPSELLSDPSLSRITQSEMKELMIEASSKLAQILELREKDPTGYKRLLQGYNFMYCSSWER